MIAPRPASIASALALASLALACQEPEVREIPNRVLDRPTDAALICASVQCVDADGDNIDDPGECEMQAEPLSVCASEVGSCSSRVPHLVGFVANSERNEIAMFTKCANRLVDMNIDAPGYNFMPAGILPTELDASADGCRVISANVGSCDISLLDAPTLAGYGIDLPEADRPDEPSTLLSTLVPQRFRPSQGDVSGQWIPLAARPGEILSVPSTLTTSPTGADNLEGICDPQAKASAYVSFPTCNLVAELDLQTGRILQSRQFMADDFGGVEIVDSGISPVCPVECPVQFSDDGVGLPDDLPEVDSEGPFVQSLELALRPSADDPEISGQQLYVGGLGSDLLFEIPIEDGGQWASTTKQLELADAGGIKGIRVSPKVEVEDTIGGMVDAQTYRFIYVMAGDGSTRVVGRTFPVTDDALGVECETQLDPNLIDTGQPSYCPPVSQSPNEGQPTERRGDARGPGIRPGSGEEVTDWMFVKTEETSGDPESADDSNDQLLGGPFGEPGTVAVGVTNGGFGVFVMINQDRALGATTPADLLGGGGEPDPANLMDVRLFSHAPWPDPGTLGLPLVVDEVPGRTSTSGVRTLAPTLRRIDAAYAEDAQAQSAFGIVELDQMRDFYDEDVARIAVHDYRSWLGSSADGWQLEWEGTIPGTFSSSGRLDCAKPGWQDATCLVDEPGDAKLIDDAATFCDDGVLPGDKLVLVGCSSDDECGDGRRCLRESASDVGSQARGICIPAHVYEESAAQMREVCAEFISDPCGRVDREYTITRAFQDELWIQAMDQPERAYLREYDEDAGCPANNALAANGDCVCLAGTSVEACGGVGEDGECCLEPGGLLASQAPVVELEDRFVCVDPDEDTLGDGTCEEDSECSAGICVDGRCRRACGPDEDCILRRLPGPACFAEFVRYQVGLRNSFRVTGPRVGFYTDLIDNVEVTDPDDPAFGKQECQLTANSSISRLLTGRLPLPPSDDPDDPAWQAIPVCDGDSVNPGEANPCRITAARSLAAKYHVFDYEGAATVSALRFSNPALSLILDLSSLEALSGEVPGYEDTVWPYDAARFRRSRIPRGYRLEFGLDPGYLIFADRVILGGRPVTYPVRIIPAPQSNVAYIVDSSGPGSSSSIRGQVVRVTLGGDIATTEAFDGVR